MKRSGGEDYLNLSSGLGKPGSQVNRFVSCNGAGDAEKDVFVLQECGHSPELNFIDRHPTNVTGCFQTGIELDHVYGRATKLKISLTSSSVFRMPAMLIGPTWKSLIKIVVLASPVSVFP